MAGTKGIVSSQYYTFNAANRTITFSQDYLGLELGQITYITNIKGGLSTVIYDPFDVTKGGNLTGLVLNLDFDTTSMTDSDPLQVILGFTPINADPLPVKIIESPDQKDDTELLNRIADGIEFLNLSLDQAEGTQVNTRESNPAKRDENNAQVVSDGIQRQFVLAANNDSATVDTTGYISVEFYCRGSNNATITLSVETSPDQNIWTSVVSMDLATPATYSLTTYTITANSTRRILIAAYSKYARIRISSFTAGSVLVVSTLKQTPIGLGPLSQFPVNVAQYAGTAVATAQQVDAAGNLASAGNFAIGSSYVATTNRPNAFTTLATGVPYPHAIGGREQPYIGALAGVFRHTLVDGGGRFILGGDTPDTETRTQSKLASNAIPGIPPRGIGGISNNMVGSQSMTVNVTNQDYGDTQVSLLRQILTELKILNQNFAEMPQMLNSSSYELSDPQEFRDDGAFDSPTQ